MVQSSARGNLSIQPPFMQSVHSSIFPSGHPSTYSSVHDDYNDVEDGDDDEGDDDYDDDDDDDDDDNDDDAEEEEEEEEEEGRRRRGGGGRGGGWWSPDKPSINLSPLWWKEKNLLLEELFLEAFQVGNYNSFRFENTLLPLLLAILIRIYSFCGTKHEMKSERIKKNHVYKIISKKYKKKRNLSLVAESIF